MFRGDVGDCAEGWMKCAKALSASVKFKSLALDLLNLQDKRKSNDFLYVLFQNLTIHTLYEFVLTYSSTLNILTHLILLINLWGSY